MTTKQDWKSWSWNIISIIFTCTVTMYILKFMMMRRHRVRIQILYSASISRKDHQMIDGVSFYLWSSFNSGQWSADTWSWDKLFVCLVTPTSAQHACLWPWPLHVSKKHQEPFGYHGPGLGVTHLASSRQINDTKYCLLCKNILDFLFVVVFVHLTYSNLKKQASTNIPQFNVFSLARSNITSKHDSSIVCPKANFTQKKTSPYHKQPTLTLQISGSISATHTLAALNVKISDRILSWHE